MTIAIHANAAYSCDNPCSEFCSDPADLAADEPGHDSRRRCATKSWECSTRPSDTCPRCLG